MDKLDDYDNKILKVLQNNARITVTELASRVGLSKTPCQIRMKHLHDRGYILGYTVVTNPQKLGAGHIAFVQVTLNDTTSRALAAFNEAARHLPQVEECHMIAGGFDYLLKVRTRDIQAYREILGEKISALPHVSQTSTYVVMEAVKEAPPGF